MKRGTLKRKTRLKSTVPFQSRYMTQGKTKKRRAKSDVKKAKETLWELCKLITRKRYQNPDGTWTCYTSGKILYPDNMYDVHTGHGKPMGALPLLYKYDLRNLRIQSMNANKNNGGESDIFIAKLEREPEGLAFLQEACEKTDGVWKIKHIPTMGSAEAREFINHKIAEYTEILHNLNRHD